MAFANRNENFYTRYYDRWKREDELEQKRVKENSMKQVQGKHENVFKRVPQMNRSAKKVGLIVSKWSVLFELEALLGLEKYALGDLHFSSKQSVLELLVEKVKELKRVK